MIRKLTEADDRSVQALVRQKPAENLFIIGDIEAFGYQQSFQEVWGDFDDHDQLRAVLLRYEDNYIPFSLTPFDAEGFADIINQSKKKSVLSGLESVTNQVIPYLHHKSENPRRLYYAKCATDCQLPPIDLNDVKQLQVDDLDKWATFIKSVPEFEDSKESINTKTKQRDLEQGVGRGYFIEMDDRVVSTASTVAENSHSAMVVAVATDHRYMGQGLATKCLTKLIQDLINEDKELCLFYDNPSAGDIYKKLGFEDIERWTLYR
ncbi:hypothetical protein SAMN05421734_104173 [Pelagirhabdus alkalitolerans]|uniref:N-acetyltransferase domain-containing protein n=1 Tax=Pelagirhabdus alkalitolerans TaxID=1612202 RepID=A0A1G6IYK8_9BACI|nr:GNAT family N-acetyltransferase [Pelagirhabdus alkalitolerans]SDC11491.1 hypothetical protein SAMN05421734_104173 [Pelagirhabdus alkalitolerans]